MDLWNSVWVSVLRDEMSTFDITQKLRNQMCKDKSDPVISADLLLQSDLAMNL